MFTSPWQKPFRGMQINKAHPLARGLVGAWVMNEATGDKVFDLSGHGKNGSFFGGLSWSAGGLSFDGSDDRINVDSIQSTTNEISIVARVSEIYGGDSRHGIVNRYTSISDWTFRTGLSRELSWLPFSGGEISSAANILSDGNWHDTIATNKSGEQKIYLDGIVVASGSTSGNLATTTNPIYIGLDYTSGRNWYGGMQHVFIYDRALSAEEVAWITREPYAMFEQLISPASLYYEAIAATDVYLTLSQTAGITESGQANTQGPVTLSSSLAAVDGGGANTFGPITLSDLLGIVHLGQANTNAPVTISDILSIAEAGQANTDGATSLASTLSFTTGAEGIAQSTLTIAEILTVIQSATTGTPSQINTENKRRSVQGIFSVPDNLISGRDKQQAAGFYRGLEADILVSISLAYDLAVQSQSTSTAAAALTMAINAGISATVSIEITEDVLLPQSLALSQAGVATSQSQLSLNNILSIAVVAEALASAGISLNMVEVVITDSGPTFEVTTPSGRTITIAAEVRTATVADEDRTVVIN